MPQTQFPVYNPDAAVLAYLQALEAREAVVEQGWQNIARQSEQSGQVTQTSP